MEYIECGTNIYSLEMIKWILIEEQGIYLITSLYDKDWLVVDDIVEEWAIENEDLLWSQWKKMLIDYLNKN